MPESKENKKKVMWLAILLLLIGSATGYYFLRPNNQPVMISADLLPELGDATDREIAERAQEIADANYFTLNINPKTIFESGTSEGSIQIVNPATNVYPIAVDITLNETGELLYQSGAIFPNQEIMSARLLIDLEQGEYLSTATINIYDPETQVKQGVTEAEVTIIIEN